MTPYNSISSFEYIRGNIPEEYWNSLVYSEAKRMVNAANAGFPQSAWNDANSMVVSYTDSKMSGKTQIFNTPIDAIIGEYNSVAITIHEYFRSKVTADYFKDFTNAKGDPVAWANVFNSWVDIWIGLKNGGASTIDGVDFRGWMLWMNMRFPGFKTAKQKVIQWYLDNNQSYIRKLKDVFDYDLNEEWTTTMYENIKRDLKMAQKISNGSRIPMFEQFDTKNPAMMSTSSGLTDTIKGVITAFHEVYPNGISPRESSGWMLDQVFRKIIETLMDDAAVTGFTSHIELVSAVAAFFKESVNKYGKVFMMGENSFHDWLFSVRGNKF